MPGSESNYYHNFINGITYENYIWKDRYNNLWLNYLNLQNENYRLQIQLQDCMNTVSDTTVNTETTTEKNINNDIVLHLQNKKKIIFCWENLKKSNPHQIFLVKIYSNWNICYFFQGFLGHVSSLYSYSNSISSNYINIVFLYYISVSYGNSEPTHYFFLQRKPAF